MGVAGQEAGDLGDPFVDLAAQCAAVRGTRCVDVFEGDGLGGVVGADRPAEKPVAVEHPDLGDVAWVVADGDRFPDVIGQGGGEVAQALEVDAVAVHSAGCGDHDQQEVEVFEAGGHPGQPAVADPGRTW